MLVKAKDEKYAVGQFNINNLEWTKSILSACEEMVPGYPRGFRGARPAIWAGSKPSSDG